MKLLHVQNKCIYTFIVIMSTLKRREEAYSGSLTGIQQSPQELEQAVYDKSKTRVSDHNVPGRHQGRIKEERACNSTI